MLRPLDGPTKQDELTSVGTVTPIEVKVGASAWVDRKVITLQGDSKFYIYFADEGETPSAADVANKGFTQFKNAKESYEAGSRQSVWVLAVSGTVDIILAERG